MTTHNEIEIVDSGVRAMLERMRELLGGTLRVEFGTNVPYAAIHNSGGEAGRVDRRVKIPARPFMPPLPNGELNKTDSEETIAILNDAIARAYAGERITGREAMSSVGRYFKTSTQLRFRDQRGPDGRAWEPSQRVKARGGQTLRLTGRLRNSLTYIAGETAL